MRRLLIDPIRYVLRHLDIEVTRATSLAALHDQIAKTRSSAYDIEFLTNIQIKNADSILKYFSQSKSQLRQDLFVLSQLNFKKGGYFVEFGATDGVNLSNSYLMEKEFGWNGILAEPAKCWHVELKKNRNCSIETDCVWKDSVSKLTFNEVSVAELSTIDNYSSDDMHRTLRENGNKYDVESISLNDLLKKHNAPTRIDYLSIDTEGSEFDILNNFDFSKHSFNVITCEHNYTPMRDELYKLLTKQGYNRVYQNLSLFDDWYIKQD